MAMSSAAMDPALLIMSCISGANSMRSFSSAAPVVIMRGLKYGYGMA